MSPLEGRAWARIAEERSLVNPSQAAGEAAVLVSPHAEGRALMDLVLLTRSRRAPWVAGEDVCAVATSAGGIAPGLSAFLAIPRAFLLMTLDLNPAQT